MIQFSNNFGYKKSKKIFFFFLQNSIVLSKQLASLGQSPTIHTFLKRKSYFPHGKVNGYLIFKFQI